MCQRGGDSEYPEYIYMRCCEHERKRKKKIERGKKIYYRSGIADAKKGGGRMSFGDKGQQGETDKQTDEQKNYSEGLQCSLL